MKVLTSPLAGARRNFLREIDILKSLAGRPGVVRLVAAAADARLTFHACDRAGGCSLDGLAGTAAARDLAVILRHGATLATWLVGLHRLGIAHRDLSPDHVFVGPDAALTVVDFGMAKRTRRLRAAERRRCEAYDVQALGMIVWETICGRAIFPYRDPRLPSVLWREVNLVRGSALPLSVRSLLVGCFAAHSECTPTGMPPHRAFNDARQVAVSLARTADCRPALR